jgi:hypothetical protein
MKQFDKHCIVREIEITSMYKVFLNGYKTAGDFICEKE